MRQNGKIDYVEFAAGDLTAMKRFYGEAFNWCFVDYGPSYAAFEDAGLDGGFAAGAGVSGKPLIILYADDLEAMQATIEAAGGEITLPIFPFPGGRRFHFQDPAGNELAVWSEA
jgi:predicted enzyme related to lactoylglutathione lyase